MISDDDGKTKEIEVKEVQEVEQNVIEEVKENGESMPEQQQRDC